MSSDLRGDLVAALAGFYAGHPDAERYPMLSEVGRLLTAALDTVEVVVNEPVVLPVARLLADVDPESDVPGVGPVLRTLAAAAATLHWVQTAEYVATLSQHFLDNSGAVRASRPAGRSEASGVPGGRGVAGAGLHYPRHEHPAEETYHLLHGSASFQRDDGPWEPKVVGESVHHDPWEHHAQRFGDATCVLSWAWTGDVVVNARLVPEGS